MARVETQPEWPIVAYGNIVGLGGLANQISKMSEPRGSLPYSVAQTLTFNEQRCQILLDECNKTFQIMANEIIRLQTLLNTSDANTRDLKKRLAVAVAADHRREQQIITFLGHANVMPKM